MSDFIQGMFGGLLFGGLVGFVYGFRLSRRWFKKAAACGGYPGYACPDWPNCIHEPDHD